MTLTGKLALAVGLGICVVLGIAGLWQADRESALFRAAVRRDHGVYGRSLAAVLQHVALSDGVDRALAVVAEVDRREPRLTIRWVWPRGVTEPLYTPRRPDLVPSSLGEPRSTVVAGDGGTPFMLTYVPVDIHGPRIGAIELYESLADEQRFAHQVLVRMLLTTAILASLCVGLILGFGAFFVARPVRRLADRAERIGAGDLGGRLELRQRDELADLAVAMNVMSDRLVEARERVAAETAARIDALEQLRHADRLRTVGEIASGIAHELGTPLNVVRARGSMIAAGEVAAARLPEIGGLIVENVDRMARIIRQLLDYARRAPAHRTGSGLTQPVERAVRMLEPIAARKGVVLALVVDAADLTLPIDAGQIEQAVANLVVNALDATPAGGRVDVRVRTEDGNAVVEVSDTGRGIDPAVVARVFEPFFTTKDEGAGTGLGLSLADGIVREHGGRIAVTSELGKGTRFVVRLPLRGLPA